jgi:protein required for attachment to host cells
MKPWYLVVTDSGRARFLELEWPADPQVEGGPKLSEIGDLANPEAALKDRELFSGKSGRNSASAGRPGSGYDDHRDRHRDEYAERFARQIADSVEAYFNERHPERMILAADPQMLGRLRRTLKPTLFRQTELTELSENLGGQSLTQIHKLLVQQQLLPAHHAPSEGFYYPPGQPPPGSTSRF